MQITMQRTRPAWPAKTKLRMTLDCSRKAKEMAMMSGLFAEGRSRHCFILAKDKNEKDQKNLRRNLVDYCPNRAITSNKP